MGVFKKREEGQQPFANYGLFRARLGLVDSLKSKQKSNRNNVKIETALKLKYDLKKYF